MKMVTNHKQHGPPDGGWGWLVVFCCFVNLFLLTSCFISFGIMYVDLARAFQVNNAVVSLIGSIQTGFAFFFSKYIYKV